jgi:hypothetical protein
MFKIIVAVLVFAFSACSQKSINLDENNSTSNEQIKEIACKNPRPQVCTMNYQPVCGRVDTGIRCIKAPCPASKFKTFSNACAACSNPKVYGYTDGRCKQDLSIIK